jgi:hypothetical protein
MSLSAGLAQQPTIHLLTDQAAADGFFQPLNTIPLEPAAKSYTHPDSYTPFNIDLPDLEATLRTAPMEFTSAANDPLVLSLPRPDGTLARFNVVEAPIMEAGLATQFPDIKTFRGQGIDDPSASIRFDYTPQGFHAQILSPNGAYYVDPYYHLEPDGAYISYFKSDLRPTQAWQCYDVDDHPAETGAGAGGGLSFVTPSLVSGGTLRTYRAAVAGDGEYTAFQGGTVALGQAAIVTAMNRVTGVYETECAIRMTLVANNSSIVYTNASTDPYTNNNPSSLLTQNQSNLDTVIGNANYDIGHVFTTGGGGLAGLSVVSRAGIKARGETGLPSPTGDAFYIDFVAHEMGHEFGANHTMNSTAVGGNRNGATAYEPGSGTTIMAYAGVVGSGEDLQPHSDPYFHFISLQEIQNYTAGLGVPFSSAVTGNTPPTVNAGSTFTIPSLTPFAMTATGSDPDGDPITFDWQERDLGVAQLLSDADNGASPLLRDWPPTASPTRFFPRLSNLLNNTTALGEKLPTVSRTMNFRVIARDNRSGGGGVGTSDVSISVVATGAAFSITNLNSAASLAGGSVQNLTWNVAGTTGFGINTPNVKISLSTDGGNTFSTVLLASTPNDGSENITLPNINTTTARIKVEAVGNIFFDVNNANLTINQVIQSAPPGTPDLAFGSDTGVLSTDNITFKNNNTIGSNLQFTVGGTVSGAIIKVFSDGTQIGQATASGATTTVTTNGLNVLSDGSHNITATQTESGKSESAASGPLQIMVDTLPPSLSAPTDFKFLVAPQSLVYQFSENVQPALITADVDLQNTSTSTTILPGQMSLGYVSNVGTITFTGLSNQILADGNYTATLTGVTDVAGNALPTDVLNFFFLMGDANHDATVDTTDFNILAAHFSQSGNYGDADFNYDGTVDTTDFNLLASNFSATLAASRPTQASPLGAMPFSTAPILNSTDKQRDEGIEQII